MFDSNISAKYGQFTGGLINADIKDPNRNRASGRVFYRTTRDNWAKYHVNEDVDGDFYQASKLSYQPQFTKQQYGIELNQPINDSASILFAYNQSQSEIPYYDTALQQWSEQKRKNETYLLKGVYQPSDKNTFKATVMYSPHESAYPKRGVKDGYFTNTGGGWRANLEWVNKADWGKMTSYLGYRKTGNEIKHEADNYHTYLATPSIDWCTSYNTRGVCTLANYGGYGEFETTKDIYTIKQDYKFNTLGNIIKHDVSTGWQFDYATASYERLNDVYAYSRYRATTATNCTECIAGEQYADRRVFYPARSVKAKDSTVSYYAEDSMTYKRLNFVAGLRADYSQYLGNVDVAPRLSFTYDVFDDKKTRIFGGYNRYYGGSMLAYKLRNGIGTQAIQTRSSALADWATQSSTTGSAGNSYDVSSLKTPYNDELNFGFAQKLGNSLWTLKWVRRDGKDQYTRTTAGIAPNSYRVLDNSGTSTHQNFSLAINSTSPISLKYADIDWSFGASYSKNKTNNSYYENTSIEADGIDKAVYRGELIDGDAVPMLDFNSPWTTFLSINTHFAKYNLDWSQRLSYTDGYRSIQRRQGSCSSSIAACGDYTGPVYIYTDQDNANAFTWDWRLGYRLPFNNGSSLELTADINNILDRKIATASPTGSNTNTGTSYKLGRNFWLGISYNW